MTTPDYVPISCDRYSELEVLADRRAEVIAECETAAGDLEQVRGRVLDLVTRNGAEYLLLGHEPADAAPLRLDRLRSLARPDGAPIWRREPDACQTPFPTD